MITVVTPLYRVQNFEKLYENILSVLAGQDWKWMVIVDRLMNESYQVPHDNPRIIPMSYEGGSRWKAGYARNMAKGADDGWIVNLDDDCLLHANLSRILEMIHPCHDVIAWQTLNREGLVQCCPRPKEELCDSSAFGYQRRLLDEIEWGEMPRNDTSFFTAARMKKQVVYFGVPGQYWNVNL